MIQTSEIAAREYTPQELPKQPRLWWGLAVAKMVLRNPGSLKKLRVMGPDEPRFVRPPRAYELPAYREGMKRCTSNEKYLRPTRCCNPREPLVIALANELGAYELSDWDFAEAAYWWVKTKLVAEILPIDRVSATLERGTGTCLHQTSLWIALCRAAGIKARYKMFQTVISDVVTDLKLTEFTDLTEAEQATMTDAFNNTGVGHSEGEACIDRKWVVADVGMRPELYAQAGTPIPKFGEEAIGLALKLISGTIKHIESLPLTVGITMRLQSWLAPMGMERVSLVLSAPLGKRIIEDAGGIEAYDRSARRRRELLATDEIARQIREAQRPQFVEFKR
jgi:hypothetical protein